MGIGAEGDDHYAQIAANISTDQAVIHTKLSDGMVQSYKSYLGPDHATDMPLPTDGISLAHAAMPERVIIAAKGKNKAMPVFNMLCAERAPNNAPEISTTHLRDLKNVTIILDREAASEIMKNQASLPLRTEVLEYQK